jgi:predicted small lipoprotein YifL
MLNSEGFFNRLFAGTETVADAISFIMHRLGIILAAISVFGLSACGQYGPLYLPDRPAPSTKTDTEFDAQPAKSDPSRQPRTP